MINLIKNYSENIFPVITETSSQTSTTATYSNNGGGLLQLSSLSSSPSSSSSLSSFGRNYNSTESMHGEKNASEFFSNYPSSAPIIIISNRTSDNETSKYEVRETLQHTLDWSDLCLVSLFCILIVITVIGNTLVILSVITTRRLRTITNCFVMSLAVADWLVGIFVMPPAVAVHLMGSWQLGWVLCDIWISLDVLLCTASILSLCAISIDRYLAVTQPLNYSRRRRSKRLALLMILVVWVLALAITCPPILGWYEPGRRDLIECRYNQNEGYVVFSAMGSFFIPMAVMIYVYVKISCVVASRHEHMAEIEVHKKGQRNRDAETELEVDHDTSEPSSPRRTRSGGQLAGLNNFTKKDSIEESGNCGGTGGGGSSTTGTGGGGGMGGSGIPTGTILSSTGITKHYKNGHYELVDCSRTPSLKRSTTINCKHSTNIDTWPNSGQCQHQQFNIKQSSAAINNTAEYTVSRNMRVHQKSLSNRILSLKRENKTTQTLSIVVGGFIACWLPFFICYLITPFLPQKSISPVLTAFLTWLGWFNSAVNPFIYAFYSVDFRAAFWRLTLRRFFKNSRKAPFASTTLSIRR